MIAVYARQSVDKKDSISIETQIEHCRREISVNDFEIYQDKGFSGKNTSRPDFKRLMDDVAAGKIARVIVYRLDRISRSLADFIEIYTVLKDNGVEFVSTIEKFDTATPMGRAMLYIIMVFAQLERETIAERVRDNYYARGKTGAWLGGPAPFGFDLSRVNHNGRSVPCLIPNKDIGIVKEIFAMYANSGASLGTIARSLANERGGMWNNIKLSRIIHNPCYVKSGVDVYHFYRSKNVIIVNPVDDFIAKYGCSLYGKRDRGENKWNALNDHVLSIAMHEGVIDESEWLKCQYKSSENQQIKNTGKGKHSWLTGLVKCGFCGHGMRILNSRGIKYLNCTGKYNHTCDAENSPHYLEEVERAVSDAMISRVAGSSARLQVKNNMDESERNGLKIELEKIDAQISNLVDSLASMGSSSARYVGERLEALDKLRAETADKLARSSPNPSNDLIPDLSGWQNFDMEQRRGFAKMMINRVQLFPNEIKIEWRD